MLTKTIEAGRTSGVIDEDSVGRVAVDTTVMEKTIAHPTDARLYERARSQLVDLAREADVRLRKSYARLAPKLARQVGRYAHARQFKRMRKALKRLKGYTGRVLRDLRRYPMWMSLVAVGIAMCQSCCVNGQAEGEGIDWRGYHHRPRSSISRDFRAPVGAELWSWT